MQIICMSSPKMLSTQIQMRHTAVSTKVVQKKAYKRTRQCRKVVWEILNKFKKNMLKAQNPFCFF